MSDRETMQQELERKLEERKAYPPHSEKRMRCSARIAALKEGLKQQDQVDEFQRTFGRRSQ